MEFSFSQLFKVNSGLVTESRDPVTDAYSDRWTKKKTERGGGGLRTNSREGKWLTLRPSTHSF